MFVVLIILAAAARFYNLEGSLMFLGDQGRDALIVSKIFLQHDPVFIGPVTSVGNLYLGPFYYYFMLPWLFLSYPNPVGPAVAVAIVSLLAIILLHKETKAIFGTSTALLSSAFFAFSSTVVTYSRFSWNPNIEPFFSIFLLFSLFRFWQDRSHFQLLWISIATAVLLQLHYITLLVLPVIGVIWLLDLVRTWQHKDSRRSLAAWTGMAVGVLLFSFIPLVFFDIKHEGLNSKGAVEIFRSDSFHEVAPWWERAQRIFMELHGRAMHIFFEVQIGNNRLLNTWMLVVVLAAVTLLLVRLRGRQRAFLILLSLFLVTAIIGLSFYTSSVFDHYLLFAIPFACLVFGIILGQVWESKFILGRIAVIVIVIGYLFYNLPKYPLQNSGLSTSFILQTTREIHKIIEPGEKYSIMLLSASRDSYGQNYRYFLSTDPEKIPVEPELHQSADTLIIINEERVAAEPLSLPIYELVVFPNKSPAQVLQLPHGPELFVLRRNSSRV
ncbi:MAG: hypothetical protein GW946_01295 [Candidatus Pacebacteria bacterium]|nr:hypothetical protein [Candidatus Paceibacterota bacterium]PIR60779.1 MAG: hypothetical protein COU67_00645 [Candidatus Pacebacteria bacterium CG10_big_fil_rev_8_21_14_0_10_44_54]